jgi:hypothetical protein
VAGDIRFRLSNYQGNLPEGDCRGVKLRCEPMPGVVRHSNAAITIVGVELLRRFQKDHFYRSSLRLEGSNCGGRLGRSASSLIRVPLALCRFRRMAACTRTGA